MQKCRFNFKLNRHFYVWLENFLCIGQSWIGDAQQCVAKIL
ncbi:MAG: hypothetical protein OFPI_35430 [Osedax symbiont Rs2]|nr:MAG: hypothetical protein OFPI_35430 [Osedax symbiont Rs2]